MSGVDVAVAIVLALAVIGEWLAALGLLAMNTIYSRLHYVGLASIVGPPLIVVAVALPHSSAEGVIKTILAAAALLIISPVLTHATARAAGPRAGSGPQRGQKMNPLAFTSLILVALGGTAVVLTRDPVRQAIVLSFYGLLLTLLFLVLQVAGCRPFGVGRWRGGASGDPVG